MWIDTTINDNNNALMKIIRYNKHIVELELKKSVNKSNNFKIYYFDEGILKNIIF